MTEKIELLPSGDLVCGVCGKYWKEIPEGCDWKGCPLCKKERELKKLGCIREDWKDIWFAVQFFPERVEHDLAVIYKVSFLVFRVTGIDLGDDSLSFWPDDDENIDTAEVYAEGWIKWDGCIEIKFSDIPCHFCDGEMVGQHSEMVTRLYKRGLEIIKEGGEDVE